MKIQRGKGLEDIFGGEKEIKQQNSQQTRLHSFPI